MWYNMADRRGDPEVKIRRRVLKELNYMKFTFAEKKFQSTDNLRNYAEKKVSKLDRFFKDEAEAFITFGLEKSRQMVELTIKSGGMYFRVSEVTHDMYASVDSAVAAVERQIRKNKTRLAKKLREGPMEWSTTVISEEPEEEEFRILRTKTFSIKPMAPEEAILQMNLLEHEFFVFRNQNADDEYAVVYKRDNGGYGLIECKD